MKPRPCLVSSLSMLALALLSSQAFAAPKQSAITQLPADAPERRLLTVVPPPCVGPDCLQDSEPVAPQAVGLRRVFLNFEGVTLTSTTSTQVDDATSNRTWMINTVVNPGSTLTIPPFNPNELGSLSGATSRQQIIDYTVDKMREYHTPYNIEFTTTRPTSGTYHMVVFGGTCGGVVGDNCAGIAPLDCADLSPSNIVFAFPSGLRAVDLATTATQEMAHAFGLTHTLDSTDFMYPSIQDSLPTHYGAGAVPGQDQGGCGVGNFQDSHAKLLSIVGFPGQDGTPPSVLITEPANGTVVKLGDPVTANISDANAIAKVELLLNNQVVLTKTSPPYDFQVPPTAPLGQVILDVRATDASGNAAASRVTVYIGTGTEEPCQNGQCADGFTCAEMLCYPDEPVNSGALGDLCVANEDCDSSVCASANEEQRCSQSCNADNLCPEGFECLSDTACWPKAGGGDGGGCSISGSAPSVLSSIGLVFFAVLLAGRRRRQR